MKITAAVVSIVLLVAAQNAFGQFPAEDVSRYAIKDFAFEHGQTLPSVVVAYATRGRLNAEKSNAVLLPSPYAADLHGYDALVGPGRALDPNKQFLILTGMFANGQSSSPSNTPAPHSGPDFPRVTIRDNVRAAHELVTQQLGITKLKAVVGYSMGAQQAYQWAVSYPEMVESIAVICGNAKQYPFGVIRLEGSIAALKADSAWNNGHYTLPPVKGLRAFALHYAAWSQSPASWPRDMLDGMSDQQVDQFLRSLEAPALGMDANNILSQAETWKRHNIGDTPGYIGNVEAALRAIKARVLLMPCRSDLYFPVADAEYEATILQNGELAVIESSTGHAAGGGADPQAIRFIDEKLIGLLK
ncbi:MAG: alpha/beta fold hydrolase [Planctomycetaceae bacterium]|nr:alpha/beta fold hydrolase [Planctomycetaceae bacterium]